MVDKEPDWKAMTYTRHTMKVQIHSNKVWTGRVVEQVSTHSKTTMRYHSSNDPWLPISDLIDPVSRNIRDSE